MLSQYEVKSAREAAGFSQRELAKLVGVSKNTIVNWESGRTSPRSSKEHRLRQVLGLHDGPPGADPDRAPPLDDDTVAAALRQASHLQVLAELARRIQASQDPDRELPPVPQVRLEWPLHGVPDTGTPDRGTQGPERSTSDGHRE